MKELTEHSDSHLIITITKGIGEAATSLAAFDAALFGAGIASYNLILLSSIIPPYSSIKKGKYQTYSSKYGDRLYVVLARSFCELPEQEAWAGIGWVQEDKNQQGFFVEHEGTNQSEVEHLIEQSIKAMANTRKLTKYSVNKELAGVQCRKWPVCAVVAAVYLSDSWFAK